MNENESQLDAEILARDLVDEIIMEEIAKLEGPECATGEHVPFDLNDPLYAHCDRCERSLHRESAEESWLANHLGGCRCVTCFPARQARGYAAVRPRRMHGHQLAGERIFPDLAYVPANGDWLWYSDADGRAIRGQVFNIRREGKFIDVLSATPGVLTPASIHCRYILRAASAPETV